MTFTHRRGLRTLGVLCAASAVLAAIPAGSALAADSSAGTSPLIEPSLADALKAAPELEGATLDTSGVRFLPDGMTATNGKFASTKSVILTNNYDSNPIDSLDNRTLTTDIVSKAVTETSSFTRSSGFSDATAIGLSFEAKVTIKEVVELGLKTSFEHTTTYTYGLSQTDTTSETTTVTTSPQSRIVRPGHAVQVLRYLEFGKYEADLTLKGIFTGNVIIKKCGTSVSVPIGRLAAMTRDDGQGPLLPNSTPDGDLLRQTSTVRAKTDMAVLGRTETLDTLLADGTTTITTEPAVVAAASLPSPTAGNSAGSDATTRSATTAPEAQTLRGVIPCTRTLDLDTSGGAPREGTALPKGTVAVGNHTFLGKDKTLTYADRIIDRNVASVVGAWASSSGRDWATYVRTDGRAYTAILDSRTSQYEGKFPLGTRAVGFRTYLTPTGDLYIESRRIARNVTSAIGGWSGTDWVSYVSEGKGYGMSSGMGSPREEGAYPTGTRAIGNHAYLAPDGTLSFDGQVIATNVTSALGGWGNGGDWVTFVADGRGHSWSGRSHSTTDEVSLVDSAEVVGNHTYLDSEGYLYYVNNEVAQNVTSAVGGWGPGPDWATYTRADS